MQDFILPDIGEGIVECEVVKWLVTQGQTIIEDQPVVEVMTDKALVEIPAKYSGQVTKLYYAEGDIAKVHSPLFEMQINADDGQPQETAVVQKQVDDNIPTATKLAAKQGDIDTAKPASGKALASPAVRRLARELEIDLSQVAGSGDKGRVLKDDLTSVSSPEILSTSARFETTGGKRVEPIRGIKAVMAKHMMHSVFTVPHFSVSEEIEMDNLMQARGQIKGSFEKEGIKLSFMPFFIKAMSLALEKFPIINSQVNADCSEVTYFDDHNIGIAVDSKVGLVVPNIKGVQRLSLLEIAKKSNELVELARQGRLSNTDLKGGTISISNIGVLGGTVATPVINAPESAIVALGKIQRLPRFDENDAVKAVNIMHVSWSGDHRIIDGATMVRFNNLWKSYLENPLTMLAITR
ncbi:2-oxo acid dehydrogenase subunit E2 [uncultured Paraglaciecola sp.]|uniref:2-oxo acid dehydrogenase subunit E2 n=1 Tax=uncultured Paraglaciecola sp. TaxID=1765024 RepID=UPI0030DC01DD|tara:strand:+ start:81700 stop:82926 length:1227 start_codon:yes stop_codon:yes gene_type:complete